MDEMLLISMFLLNTAICYLDIKKLHKKRPTLQFTDKFDVGILQYCWSTQKNNMFNCETSHLESPKKFNTEKYSWVKYDS